jgi:hypothetical protein
MVIAMTVAHLSGCGPEQDGSRESTRVTTGGRGFKSRPADFDGR